MWHISKCSTKLVLTSFSPPTGWITKQPEMMSYGAEGPIAPHHTQTYMLLDRPYTETKQAYEESVGLWIRGPNWGFNRVLLMPLIKGAELITLQHHNTSKHVTLFELFLFKYTFFVWIHLCEYFCVQNRGEMALTWFITRQICCQNSFFHLLMTTYCQTARKKHKDSTWKMNSKDKLISYLNDRLFSLSLK